MRSRSRTLERAAEPARSGRGSGRLRAERKYRHGDHGLRMAEMVDGEAGDQGAQGVRDGKAERKVGEIQRPLLGRAVRAEHAVHGDVQEHERGYD